ncbi:secreted RxLR effector protein 161-like [Apium graveolens]|uniref:secreted RxLR effector protein 161-like n=1 Tax=Apium graveolens TaxID=4045 RepID=UPI003D7BB167
MERPKQMHMNVVKRKCRYLKGTLQYGLVYMKGQGNYILSGFSDSDLAGRVDDRKSTGGMSFYLDENLITWVSQKQRCVALSSCEVEFMAATAAACQENWLQRVLSHIMGIKSVSVTLYIDNRSAVDLARNPVFHGVVNTLTCAIIVFVTALRKVSLLLNMFVQMNNVLIY